MTHPTHRSTIIATVSLSAALLLGCSSPAPVAHTPQVVTGLSVAQVHQASIPGTVSITGTVQARESATLAAQTTGQVLNVAIHEGDHVRAGQLLVTLNAAEAHSEVVRSQANVTASQHELALAQTDANLANSTLARYQILRDRKSVSPQEFDEIQQKAQETAARVEAAKAQLAAQQAAAVGSSTMADYAHIRAPFSGVVTARRVDPGALATPGMPLLQLEKSGTLQMDIPVDQSLIASIHTGQPIAVTIPNLPHPGLHANVAAIDPAADPASRTFLVKLDLPATPGLRSGISGTALLPSTAQPALLIPTAAIVTHGSIHGAWVVDTSGIASMRYITLGATHATDTEVLSGMSPGETVVLSPADRELGGRKIEAAQ
ncbi:MAG: efflux RND transporter periplasmic adaptor subunit [Acidobacteria bacterium]|nr:efflux RND transporter periplasmic adaptor subunit [Acidobacteriota bacterium]